MIMMAVANELRFLSDSVYLFVAPPSLVGSLSDLYRSDCLAIFPCFFFFSFCSCGPNAAVFSLSCCKSRDKSPAYWPVKQALLMNAIAMQIHSLVSPTLACLPVR